MAFGTPASASAADRAYCKSSKMGGCPPLVVKEARTDRNASLLPPMPVRRLRDDEHVDVARGDVAVVIPVYGAAGDFAQCLASVARHTAPDVPVLVCDDHSPGADVERHLDGLSATGSIERVVLYARRARNL